jgi:tRNA (guanosine-2'-O-)-methyltransferase
LNVSVATAILLFEALRQRQRAGLVPEQGEGIPGGTEAHGRILFRWAYPQVADWCDRQGRPYPALTAEGEIAEQLPRTLKLRY